MELNNLKSFYLRWRFILRNFWYWEKPTILSRLTLVMMSLTIIAITFAFVLLYQELSTHEYWFLFMAMGFYCHIKTLDFIGSHTKKFVNSYYDDHSKSFKKEMKKHEQWRTALLNELGLPMNASTNQIRERLTIMNTEEQIEFYNRMIDLNKELDMFWLPQEKIKLKKEEKK